VPILYLFHGQQERSFIGGLLAAQMTVLVRTSGAPLQALGLVHETVRSMDARLRPGGRCGSIRLLRCVAVELSHLVERATQRIGEVERA
jgi:hypothetical protein